jgi:hypothetical protein
MQTHRFRRIGHLDLPGGGQVAVADGTAFVGHMRPPIGTSLIDVRDPRHPRVVGEVRVPENVHSHKVRPFGRGLIAVNHELAKGMRGPIDPGLRILDVADPARPKEVAFHRTGGIGVHRFDVDDRYAYLSTEVEGYVGAITVILDLADPARPREVSRWWLPGQHTAGGEIPAWEGKAHRTHHPLRLADRLYISCWYGGFAIVDVGDLARPRTVGRFDWSPPYPNPTHTALPIPFPLAGRRWLAVTDEDTTEEVEEDPPAFLWLVDVTAEANPVPVATYQLDPATVSRRASRFGAHQPRERVTDTVLLVTWFSGGLRAVDIRDPYRPREVGCFVPEPCGGEAVCQTNDVCTDERGLVYTIDRRRGFDILEFDRP